MVVVCPNKTKLARIREVIAAGFPAEEVSFVTCQLADKFIERLFDWAGKDPESGALERGKRRKQQITFNAEDLVEAVRKQKESDMLRQLAQVMKRKM